MHSFRYKLNEGGERPPKKTITKQLPVRSTIPLQNREQASIGVYPDYPTGEELYEETEKELDWFLETEPPLTMEEQELARTATLWTSQPRVFNADIIAQMYSDLPVVQRRIASLYMVQHLITLHKFLRHRDYALDDLMSKCTSLDFLENPSKFLNEYFNARQEYHESQSRNFSSKEKISGKGQITRQYPLREVHPKMNAAGTALERVFVYTPLTKLEIMKMKEMVPPHSKDPVGFYKELTDVLTMGTYTLSDLTTLLQKLLPPGIYEKLRGQNWEVENVRLDWAALVASDAGRLAGADIPEDVKTVPALVLKILPRLLTARKEDWDAISACKQKPDEDIGDYYTRLEKCFAANSGLRLDSESYGHLFVSKLVENTLPKLKERVQRVESSWQAQTPSQVLLILQYHQNRLREEEEREKTRLKETKIRALVAQTVMPRTGPPPQQQKITTTSKGVCNYCKKQGHYVKDLQGNVTCPVLKHNLATGKTLSRPHVPREQYKTEGRVPKSQDKETKQSAQMYMTGEDTGYADFPSFF
ncbi:hypothetical protein NDU88_003286 [Pleurodeles waltl]|uniref:Uncharacterized protein n=1 Tax=Pleurodeles waltl TaxID=8319 RepID=A0AAV7NFZ0_PLEWA|nr:hypothetical protein NDU88_003286 [Pleurodeles waltl]